MNSSIRAILALFLVSLFLLTFIPQEASAFPYRIKGYLRDGDGNPIPNGNISITGDVYDIGIQDYKETNIWLFTDNTGYYEQAVAYNEPGGFDGGATLIISYNPSNGDTGVSKPMTFNGLGSWVNLTYEKQTSVTEILFSPVGLISIVILISTVFVGYYMYKSGDEEDNTVSKPRKNVGRRRR